jgi:AraC-like DNA-binding protein
LFSRAPVLRGTFSSTWIHRMPEGSAPPVIVMPDGTIDLQWIDRTFRVAGPDKDPMIENLPAGTTIVGFRFRPAAAATWLDVPANQILGQRVSLHELWGPRARGMAGKVRDNQNIADLIAALASVIAPCPAKNALTDEPMRAAFNLVQAGPPPGVALVPWLGRALAMSERTLRRRFDESFGYGPKTLDRILRYQRFLRLVRSSQGSTAILAMEAGYSDQPHLVRESRRLAGFTPAQVERTMRTGSGRDER